MVSALPVVAFAFGPWDLGPYWFARGALLRGVGVVYLFAFLVAAFQFRPLAGEDGLLPLADYRERRSFRERPSLFYRYPDDRVVGAAAWTGVGLSVLGIVAGPGLVGTRLGVVPGVLAHVLLWSLLWVLYLSFVNAGQTFYGFGWESMLLEAGALCVFLGPASVAAPVVVVWLFRWVLFRNMFGAGLIKLRGDDCWRDLTCLDYHYETQPMPNPVSWFAHRLPDSVHRAGVVTNHVVELVVPFLYFAPQPIAAVAGLATIAFQGWLLVTGNFAFLNALTVVLAFATLSDPVVTGVLPLVTPAVPDPPLAFSAAGWAFAALVVALSYYPVRNLFGEGQVMNTAFDPLHLVNTYGAFGSITKTRYEVVLQGTDDPDPGPDSDWRTYTFPGKPTDPGKRPPQVAPYHYRLDWQLWFAAMGPSPQRHPWFVHLVAKLLDGDERVEGLLDENPFPDDPPRAVRAVRYRYAFTTPDERAESGDWWTRTPVGTYFGPVTADDPRFRVSMKRRGWTVPDVADDERAQE